MTGKKVLNEMQAYKPGKQINEVKKELGLERIVKLASNENPYGFPDKVKHLLATMPHDFELYPDPYATELREKLANKLNVENDQLIFGAGSDEIITFICRAFLAEGTNTVMATGTFPQYRHHALIEGAEVKAIPTNDGRHDLDGMLAAIDAETKVVWVCTPDNPTGTVIKEEDFTRFMEKCPEDVIVVLDEAYHEFMDETKQYDLDRHLAAYPNLISLRTFSKAYGLAGFRVGYGISSEEVATKLNIVKGPFNVTSLSQRVAVAAFDDAAFLSETIRINEEVRTDFERFLDEIGWDYYPSVTNFLLVKTPVDADTVSDYLLQEGFIVRSGNLLGYPKTIRVTIGKPDDMKELEEAISKLDSSVRDGEVQ